MLCPSPQYRDAQQSEPCHAHPMPRCPLPTTSPIRHHFRVAGTRPYKCPPGCWSLHPPPPSGLVGTAWGLRRSAHSTCQAESRDATIPWPHLSRRDAQVSPELTGPASWWWPSPASPGFAAAAYRHRRGCPSPAPVPGHYQCPGAGRPADTAGQGWGSAPHPPCRYPTPQCCRGHHHGHIPIVPMGR